MKRHIMNVLKENLLWENEEDARKLWEISEKLTGVKFDI